MRIKFFLKYYLPLLIWAVLIFYFSSIADLKSGASLPVEIVLRKTAHVGEYAILAFLIWRVVYFYHQLKLQAFWLTLLLLTLYALSDEIHQAFVPGRAGRVADVLIDISSGVWLVSLLTYFFQVRKKIYIVLSLFFLFILVGVIWQLFDQALFKQKIEQKNNLNLKIKEEDQKQENEKYTIKNNYQEQSTSGEIARNFLKNEDGANEKNSVKEADSEVYFDIPFISQAPFGLWDQTHQEACEEASVIMIAYYLKQKPLDAKTAEKEIQELKRYQLKKYGEYFDSSAERTAEFAKDFYGLPEFKVVYDFSKENLVQYLNAGNILILPVAGRKLGNPNFTAPGPLYHSLVVKGYTGDNIITNDPGTKNGKDYKYKLDVLYDAIHDWTGDKQTIESGRKAVIIIEAQFVDTK